MVNINRKFPPIGSNKYKQEIHSILGYQLTIRTSMKFLPITFHVDALRACIAKHRRQVW